MSRLSTHYYLLFFAQCPIANPNCCSGICTNTGTNPLNCGACNRIVYSPSFSLHNLSTWNGVMILTIPIQCAASTPNCCSSICTSILTDNRNCGGCGVLVCPLPWIQVPLGRFASMIQKRGMWANNIVCSAIWQRLHVAGASAPTWIQTLSPAVHAIQQYVTIPWSNFC